MENERSGMTVAKIVAEFMDRMILLAEENARMTTRLQLLFDTVKTAERERAEYCERWGYTPEYDAHLDTEEINALFGWRRDQKAIEIVERMQAERAEKEKARKEAKENGDAE